MAKTRAQKEQVVSKLAQKIADTKSMVFTQVSGYTMDDANALREKGSNEGVKVSITKKNLLVLALKEQGIEVDKGVLEGSILTSFGNTDEVAPAKLMSDFAKEKEEGIEIVGGILEGKFVDAAAIKQLATLPSKEQLLAQLVGSINAPRSGFVNVLAGNLRGMVNVLNAIKEAKA